MLSMFNCQSTATASSCGPRSMGHDTIDSPWDTLSISDQTTVVLVYHVCMPQKHLHIPCVFASQLLTMQDNCMARKGGRFACQ
jgi:hypothetical protein